MKIRIENKTFLRSLIQGTGKNQTARVLFWLSKSGNHYQWLYYSTITNSIGKKGHYIGMDSRYNKRFWNREPAVEGTCADVSVNGLTRGEKGCNHTNSRQAMITRLFKSVEAQHE